jgi:hypothetical protein
MPEFGHSPEIEEVVEIELIELHRSVYSIYSFLLIYFTEFIPMGIILATSLNKVLRWTFHRFCM